MSEQLIKALRALPRYNHGYRMSGDDRVLTQYLSDSGPFIRHADLEAALSTHHAAPGAPQQEASGGRSQIITLCGSARFERLFKAWNEALTMAGHTVFSLTAYPSDKAGVKQWYTDEQKLALDAAHFRKIEASDAVFVLNRHAYLGESTLREVAHARRLRKDVYFLESWGAGNGIGSSHTAEAQRAAEADGLVLPTTSPIDTTTRSGSKDPWASELLGPAGPLRSSIVDLTNAASRAAATAPAGHGDAEDIYVAQGAHLNCPTCGGSGHVDDATNSRAAEPAQRVFLVATGEVHEGQETYTRHEGAPPPLCDFETLWTTPPTGTSKEGGE